MCCSTEVRPAVDPVLLQFAADLEWLAGQGMGVERDNLAQQPQAFAETGALAALSRLACLPAHDPGGRNRRQAVPFRQESR
jgi:hypothetical protein